jgi:arginyl-tRNA synthetase
MRDAIREVTERTLQRLKDRGELTLERMPDFGVDLPKNPDHGDYAVNAAMMLAKPEKKKPRDIAQAIADHLDDPDGVVASVEVAGPGFLNFRVADRALVGVVRDVLGSGERWGRGAPKSGKKVNVEFVSANPTGPLHLGHARGAYMGDAAARLLEAAGHDVTREFYVNDYGKQVETLGRTVYARYCQQHGEQIELGKDQYPAEYVVDIAKKLKAEDGDKWLGKSEGEWLGRCIEIGLTENLRNIEQTLQNLGITHDTWYSEKSLYAENKVMPIVDEYEKLGKTYKAKQARGTEDKVRAEGSKAAQYKDQQKGGTFLVTSEAGDEEDRIILRHDGTPVYLTADLAYHKDKYERGYDRIIDVWGADHAGHVPRIRAGMNLLGLDESKFDFLLVQIVRMMKDGEEVRISKRSGEVYELGEFCEEVGQDVARVVFLMRSATAQFDFDLDLARKQSKENPVFYLQYGHARTCQLLKRAEEKAHAFVGADALTDAQLQRLGLPEEREMLKKMAELPGVVQGAADALEPHRVLYYCNELIAGFHSWYQQGAKGDPIISDDDEKTQGRLALVAAVRDTLRSALAILGITAPDHMEPPSDEEGEEA